MKRYIFSAYTIPENPVNPLTNTWSEWVSLGGTHQSAPAIFYTPYNQHQNELTIPSLSIYTTGINGDIQRGHVLDRS